LSASTIKANEGVPPRRILMATPIQLWISAHIVDDMVKLVLAGLQRLNHALLLVVHDFICAEAFTKLDIRGRASRRYMTSHSLGDLNPKYTCPT
jgi:hypothetical protein